MLKLEPQTQLGAQNLSAPCAPRCVGQEALHCWCDAEGPSGPSASHGARKQHQVNDRGCQVQPDTNASHPQPVLFTSSETACSQPVKQRSQFAASLRRR